MSELSLVEQRFVAMETERLFESGRNYIAQLAEAVAGHLLPYEALRAFEKTFADALEKFMASEPFVAALEKSVADDLFKLFCDIARADAPAIKKDVRDLGNEIENRARELGCRIAKVEAARSSMGPHELTVDARLNETAERLHAVQARIDDMAQTLDWQADLITRLTRQSHKPKKGE